MAVKIRKKKQLKTNVYEEACERIRYLYQRFDKIMVSFSGGKDSTAMLLCAIDVATELGRLPVECVFYDEEAIHPPTIDYVKRVAARDDVLMHWYCVPIKHRNACSNESPFWRPWDPECEDKWVRPLPDDVPIITEHERLEPWMSMQDFGVAHFKNTGYCVIQGLRTQESLRRYRVVAMKQKDNYIASPESGVYFAYPIYDMSSEDVWTMVKKKGEDYNRTYDILNRTDMYNDLLRQRVCPPYGEEPLRGLYVYAQCFPEMWHKMIDRVPGAATAARYGNTELYMNSKPPEGVTWRQHVQNIVDTFDGKHKKQVEAALNAALRHHKNKTNMPIPEDQSHPVSGLSWAFLVKMATRGDFKGRILQQLASQAQGAQNKMGMTAKEAKAKFGKVNKP